MPLLHGREISADEIEAEIARWSAERFARLCNAVAWASPNITGWRQTIPVFSERVHVADNGIDAEWERVLSAGEAPPLEALLRPGVNVFQYKKRGAAPGNRADIVSALVAELRRAVLDVEIRTGKTLASYVLWTNVDLSVDQHERIRAAILDGHSEDEPAPIHANVVGAAELAAMINDLPHLRSAFLTTDAFQDWGLSFEAHQRESLLTDSSGRLAPLIGRDRSVEELRTLVDRPSVRAIVVTGPHMIGKSRLILEATRHRDVDVAEALDSGAVNADSMRRLAKAGRETILLLQDATADIAERVCRQALAVGDTIKVIIALPTRDGAPLPNFGLDDRACLLPVPPLDDEAARQLFTHHIGQDRVDFGIESWIVEQAGGVPGILLAASRFGRELRPGASTFTEQIGRAFEARLGRTVPHASSRQALALAALLTYVRVEPRDDPELHALCRPAFGVQPHQFGAAIEPLEAAAHLSRKGSFVEATPPILANRLAARIAQGQPVEVMALFQALADGGRRRVLRRLAQLPDQSATRFWSQLFGPDGPLGSLPAVLNNIELFRATAAAGVMQAVEIVHTGLKTSLPSWRRQLVGEPRHALVFSLQELMAAATTAEAAFRSLALLAEAETEDFGNNAAGIFCHGADPLNSQIPLALGGRLRVLQELLAPEREVEGAMVALEAIRNTLGPGRPMILVPSRGARPAGGLPAGMGWGDVRAYCAGLIDAIAKAADDPRPAVRRQAKSVWPGAAERLVYDLDGNAERGIAAFAQIVDRILQDDPEFPVAPTIETLILCRTNLGGALAGRGANGTADLAAALNRFLTRLATASFNVRLRWRVGNSWREMEEEGAVEPAEGRDPYTVKAAAISGLAEEACAAPEQFSPELIAWCDTEEANAAGQFWHELGRHDGTGLWIETVVGLARGKTSWTAAVSYVGGASTRDACAGRAVFMRLAEAADTRPEAIAYSSARAEGGDQASRRVAEFVRAGTLTPQDATRFAERPDFQDKVSPGPFTALLEAIVGDHIERPELAVHALWFWFHGHPAHDLADPVVVFAWRCLEARLPTHRGHSGADTANIAADLVRLDPERGFRLVEAAAARLIAAMRNPGSDIYGIWSPFENAGTRRPCWEALRGIDHDRALGIVLDHAAQAGSDGLNLTLQLKYLIQMPDDVDFLQAYAARGVAEADVVASAIASSDPGFWDVACEIIERYPENESLRRKLGLAAGGFAGGFFGGLAAHAEDAVAQIETILNRLESRFPHARLWLGELLAAYRQSAAEMARQEADRDIDR